jgi:hypothetical protein
MWWHFLNAISHIAVPPIGAHHSKNVPARFISRIRFTLLSLAALCSPRHAVSGIGVIVSVVALNRRLFVAATRFWKDQIEAGVTGFQFAVLCE